MTLVLPRPVLARLHAQAEQAWPDEAVAVLAGDPAARRVTQVRPLPNAAAGGAFLVPGRALADAELALEREGHTILGYAHSHPDSPALPSEADRAHAWEGPSFVVVEVRAGRAVDTTCWRLHGGAFEPEPLHLPEVPNMATVHIPTPLRPFTGGQASVQLEGGTVGEILNALTTTYGGLAKHLRDPEGKLRSFVNVYVGDEDIRYLQKEETPVKADAEITIVPSIAGGAR